VIPANAIDVPRAVALASGRRPRRCAARTGAVFTYAPERVRRAAARLPSLPRSRSKWRRC